MVDDDGGGGDDGGGDGGGGGYRGQQYSCTALTQTALARLHLVMHFVKTVFSC